MNSLIRIDIAKDVNDRGERVFTATPYYRLNCGRTCSVPDSRGWATLADAKKEAERIAGFRECEFVSAR